MACARGNLEMVRELLKCPDIDPHIGVSRDEKESEIIILI